MRAPWAIRCTNAVPRPNWAAQDRKLLKLTEKIGGFEQLWRQFIGADLAALDADKIPAGWRDAEVTGRLEFGFADAQQLLPTGVAGPSCRPSMRSASAVWKPFRLPLTSDCGDLLLLELEQTIDGYDEYEVWELEEQLLSAAGYR